MTDEHDSATTDVAVEADLPERFSLVAGGWFHSVLGRLGLLQEDQLPSLKAALILAIVAWSIPAAIAILQSLATTSYSGWDYFEDPTVYARYLVAIFMMIATERMADGRVSLLIRQFRDAGLLDGLGRARFAAAVRQADARASSRRAEIIVLVIAFLWSVSTTRLASVVAADSWEGAVAADGEIVLSWAGDISAFSSNTLFLFLLMRWFWRFYIWASLLRKTSRLDLRLMPLHPDGRAGLGFLGIFPGIFSGLIIALSCVVAASLYKVAGTLGDSSQLLWLAAGVWLSLTAAIFLVPLLFFVKPLYLVRENAMLEYGRLAHGHHMEFHEKWMGPRVPGRDILGSADPSSLSDLNASVQAAHTMRVIPIDRAALVQMFACAGLPLLAMAAFRMPLGDLLKLILGVVL